MLSQGDKAPDFELESDAGTKVRLSKLRGKRVVVYFYPKDSTPGCTVEANDFTRQKPAFDALGVTVLGISRDSVKSHASFRDKQGLKITLLSDPELVAHNAFGAWGEKNMYGKKILGTIRSTFLVGEDGKVAHAWPAVKVAGHVDQVLAAARGEAPAKKAPAAKAPAAPVKAPAAKKPAAKAPAAKKPAAKAPAAKKPAAKAPAKKA
jgi:peroxiredoxin Q/BCP